MFRTFTGSAFSKFWQNVSQINLLEFRKNKHPYGKLRRTRHNFQNLGFTTLS